MRIEHTRLHIGTQHVLRRSQPGNPWQDRPGLSGCLPPTIPRNCSDPIPLLIYTPLFIQQKRDWRVPFSAAVDIYRNILTLIRELEMQKLGLTELDKLASNCPRCFGPPVGSTRPDEPDIIACLDGNFQHKRHEAASVPITDYHPPNPEIFVHPDVVLEKAEQFGGEAGSKTRDEEVVSMCLRNTSVLFMLHRVKL